MSTEPLKTVEQFVNEQPAERRIDFNQDEVTSDRCVGCVLIQYAREILKKGPHIRADFSTVNNEPVADPDYARWVVTTGMIQLIHTYGELRNLLSK